MALTQVTSGLLTNTGVSAGTYGGTSAIPVIVVNTEGQLTSATNVSISIPPSTSLFPNTGQLTSNSSTGNVAFGLATSGVTAGYYGNTYYIASLNIDSYGRIVSSSNVAVTANSSTTQFLYNSAGLVSGATGITTDGVNITTSGNLTFSSSSTTLNSPTLKAYKEVVNNVSTVATSTYNIDLSTGNIFDIRLGANVTFTFTNPPPSNISQPATIILRQGTGSNTATFANAHYTGGITPTLSTGANQVDVLTFFTTNAGAYWFGTFAMANVS